MANESYYWKLVKPGARTHILAKLHKRQIFGTLLHDIMNTTHAHPLVLKYVIESIGFLPNAEIAGSVPVLLVYCRLVCAPA